jgi:hypothetical protein
MGAENVSSIETRLHSYYVTKGCIGITYIALADQETNLREKHTNFGLALYFRRKAAMNGKCSMKVKEFIPLVENVLRTMNFPNINQEDDDPREEITDFIENDQEDDLDGSLCDSDRNNNNNNSSKKIHEWLKSVKSGNSA